MHQKSKKYILITFFVISALLMIYLYMQGYFSLSTIRYNKDLLQSLVTLYYPYAVFFYITLYILAVVCLLPFVSFLAMLGGFLFGSLWATFFIACAAALGTTILVMLMRYFFKSKTSSRSSLLQRFNTMVDRHGVAYLLCVRFIIVIPFFIVNSIVAFTTIPLSTIAWTTFIGVIPITLLFTSAGSHLEQMHHVSDLFSAKIIVVFGSLVLVSLTPLILEKLNIKL